MATSFKSLPVIDIAYLSDPSFSADSAEAQDLAEQFYDVFATSGFAYLINSPLSFSHDDIFSLSKQFFGLPEIEKWKMAKRTFQPSSENTYRGYFPIQPLKANDNLKEGFEIGSGKVKTRKAPADPSAVALDLSSAVSKFNLYEPNIWPGPASHFPAASRKRLTHLYSELQGLSSQLLALLAIALGQSPNHFESWLGDSLSTLRLLHYPPAFKLSRGLEDDTSSVASSVDTLSTTDSSIVSDHDSVFSHPIEQPTPTIHAKESESVKLACTPHTDSGILTLLHQDPTGGLEVLNSDGDWIAAPYIPGSIVVNIGDLMAKVSGGRFVATMHRVRAPTAERITHGEGFGRFSVPFFFEPGEDCVVRNIDSDGDGEGKGVRYGVHVREKMSGWVEFQDPDDKKT